MPGARACASYATLCCTRVPHVHACTSLLQGALLSSLACPPAPPIYRPTQWLLPPSSRPRFDPIRFLPDSLSCCCLPAPSCSPPGYCCHGMYLCARLHSCPRVLLLPRLRSLHLPVPLHHPCLPARHVPPPRPPCKRQRPPHPLCPALRPLACFAVAAASYPTAAGPLPPPQRLRPPRQCVSSFLLPPRPR